MTTPRKSRRQNSAVEMDKTTEVDVSYHVESTVPSDARGDAAPPGAHGDAVPIHSMRPQSRADLDKIVAAGCQTPGCTETHSLVLVPRCHRAPVLASYSAGSGILQIDCAACGQPVLRVAVAGR